MDDPWLTPEQAARRLGVSVEDLAEMRRQGEGPSYYQPYERHGRVRWVEVRTWVRRRAVRHAGARGFVR